MTALRWARETINRVLRPLDIQVVRGRSADPAVQSFLPARKTIAAAKRSGLTVGDYIDRRFAEPGTTQATVEAMLRLSGLEAPVERVCEIGPGSGRYMDQVIAALHPKVYEVYETADDWLPYLRTFPGAEIRVADGRTLKDTATAAVDLVHAQKVFVYTPFWVSVSYLREMARVVRPGGTVAFDIVTEACLDEALLDEWVGSGTVLQPIPRGWTIDYLAGRGVSYVGNHMAVLTTGTTELLVFRRDG